MTYRTKSKKFFPCVLNKEEISFKNYLSSLGYTNILYKPKHLSFVIIGSNLTTCRRITPNFFVEEENTAYFISNSIKEDVMLEIKGFFDEMCIETEFITSDFPFGEFA